MRQKKKIGIGCLVLILSLSGGAAHEAGEGHEVTPTVLTLEPGTEPGLAASDGTTGQGRWVFERSDGSLMPVPLEARGAVRGAHGTLVVDAEHDTVYWGLENVGWVAFSNRLSRSWVVDGDPALSRGNLHGGELLTRSGRPSLIAAADNVEGEVYLSGTDFKQVQRLGWPAQAPYTRAEEYHPTDVTFVGPDRVFVTDGYGAAYFMPLTVSPLGFVGDFLGGKTLSATPHGITRDVRDGSLILAARPEGMLKRWDPVQGAWLEVLTLPAGSTVCDIDIRGDLALAPCLDGPDGAPGPIYVVDLRNRTIVSTLRPKVDLGYGDAQHIHDAAWYEAEGQIYVLFTSWNPGGIGAMKLRGSGSGS